MSLQSQLDSEELRFWEYLVNQYQKKGKNGNVATIFAAIQDAFDGSNMGKPVSIDPYLIHNLAACSSASLMYNKDDELPLDTGMHDYVLIRTLRGFINSLQMNLKNGNLHQNNDGSFSSNAFDLPKWFN